MEIKRKCIKKIDDFEELRTIWEKIQYGPEMTVFQEINWNILLYKELMKKVLLHNFCSVEIFWGIDKEKIVIIPILVQKISTKNKLFGKKKGIYLLGNGSYSDYLNIIYEEFNEYLVNFVIDEIKKIYKNMPVFFSDIREDTSFNNYLLLKGKMIEENVSVSVRLNKSADEYTGSLSKHTRQNLRTSVNRMNKDGKNYELEIQNNIKNERLLSELTDIHIKRMIIKNNGKKHKKIISRLKILIRIFKEKHNNIIIDSMKTMQNSVCVIVRINGEVAGYLYGLKDRRAVRIMQNCVDAQYSYYSPMFRGSYEYIVKCIEEAETEEVDFTRGDEQYKYKLGGVETKLYTYVL